MSIKDIFELSSYLCGDDKEREELERRKMVLETAIKQQESRFLHELDERQNLEEGLKDAHEHIAVIERDLDIIELFVSQSSDPCIEEKEKGMVRETQSLKEDMRIRNIEMSLLSKTFDCLEAKIARNKSVDSSSYIKKAEICHEELDKVNRRMIRNKDSRKMTEIENLKSELARCEPEIQLNREGLAKVKAILHLANKDVDDLGCAVQRAERETLRISSQLRQLLCAHDEDMQKLSYALKRAMAVVSQDYEYVCEQTKDSEELQQECRAMLTQLSDLNCSIESQQSSVEVVNQNIVRTRQELADAKSRLHNLQQKCYLLNMQIQAAANRNFVEKAESISLEAETIKEQLATLTLKNEDIRNQLQDPNGSAILGDKHRELVAIISKLQPLLDTTLPQLQRKMQEVHEAFESNTSQCAEVRGKLEESEKEKLRLEHKIKTLKSSLAVITESDACSAQKKRVAYEKHLKKMDATLARAKEDLKSAQLSHQTALAALSERQQNWSTKLADTQLCEAFRKERLREKQENFLRIQRGTISALQSTLLEKDQEFQRRLKLKETELMTRRDALKLKLKDLQSLEKLPNRKFSQDSLVSSFDHDLDLAFPEPAKLPALIIPKTVRRNENLPSSHSRALTGSHSLALPSLRHHKTPPAFPLSPDLFSPPGRFTIPVERSKTSATEHEEDKRKSRAARMRTY